MADIKTAFRTKSISLDDVVAIFQGNLDPRTNDQGTLTQVPQGSLYIRSNGELYQKTGTANLGFSLITATGSAVTILDTDLSNTLTLLEGSNLTSDRTLTFTTGDASRVLTINGNATLNDWFDQSVKTTGTPTFAQVFATGNVGIGITSPSSKLHVLNGITDTSGNTSEIKSTHATFSNASNTNSALSLSVSTLIPLGITNSGISQGLEVLAYAQSTGFGGNLTENIGGSFVAGIITAVSGATITKVYGIKSTILNSVAGTTITNAYGVFISNSATTGTITNKFDLYASSANALNYFAGSVGIGTTLPLSKLHIEDTTQDCSLRILTGATFKSEVLFAVGAITPGAVQYDHATNSIRLWTNSAERMRIDSSGNVGIGTTNPTVALDVVGDIKATGTITGTLSFTRFHVQTSGASATPTGDIVAKFEKSATTESAAITILSSTAGISSLNMGDTVSEVVGNIAYSNAGNYMAFTTNGSEAMRIDSSGNVGIGTINPLSPLHVKNTTGGSLPTIGGTTGAIFQSNNSTVTNSSISIISGTSASSIINFGDSDDENSGIIEYKNSINVGEFVFSIGGVSTYDLKWQKLSTGNPKLILPNSTYITSTAETDDFIIFGGTGTSGNPAIQLFGKSATVNAGEAFISSPTNITISAGGGSGEVLILKNSNAGIEISGATDDTVRVWGQTDGLEFWNGATIGGGNRLMSCSGGGMMLLNNGTQPTGGLKGVGTLNAIGVYDDNTLLTCYVMEAAVSNHVDVRFWDSITPHNNIHKRAHRFSKRFAEDLNIDSYSQFWKNNLHLPSMPSKQDWKHNTMSVGQFTAMLWETVEIQAVHIDKLNTRLKLVEGM